MKFWEAQLIGSSVEQWSYGLITAAVAFMVLWTARGVLIRKIAVLAIKTQTDLDDMLVEVLKKTKGWVLLVLSLYMGTLALSIPDQVRTDWVQPVALIVLVVQAAFWADTLVLFWLGRYQKERVEEDASRVTTVRALGFVLRLVLFSVAVLLALDNIPGVEVTALLASLGIGGIAIALALQSILADLFASLTIALDQPFVIGDFIIVGDFMGTVEHIGLKTTRLRSLSGEQIVFSNNDLLGSRVRNYKRMSERRILFTFKVVTDTPFDRIKEIPSLVEEIVRARENTRFDRAHFKAIEDGCLVFETVYYMLQPDYNLYMDAQQAINLELYKRFEALGIRFAHPTRTVFVQGGEPPGKTEKPSRPRSPAAAKKKTATRGKRSGK